MSASDSMSFRWFEALPFLFSIAIKLFSNVIGEFFINSLVQYIPANYNLTDDQKRTIANMALDANERTAYIVTVFVSILSAVIISYQNQAYGYSLVAVFVYGLAGIFGIIKMNAQELGWLETKIKFLGRQVRRSTLLTIFLIVLVDILLLCLSICSSIPRLKF
jgi:hypothetical protein